MSLRCYHGSVWENKGIWGNTEVGVPIHGRNRRIKKCYRTSVLLMPVLAVGLVLERMNEV